MKNYLFRTLKSRVIAAIVVLFLLLAIIFMTIARKNLREDVIALSAEQQHSIVEVASAQLNQDFDDRLKALALAANIVTPSMLSDVTVLQAELNRRVILQLLFNAGVYAIRRDGLIITDQAHNTLPFADQASINAVLSGQVKSIVGPLMQDDAHQAPLFLMVNAISDEHGEVIGAAVGATSLAKDNFIDKATSHKYGKEGGFIIVDPKHRMIVSATDKSRIMEPSPPPGLIPAIDQSLAGNESPSVFVNPKGVEVLESFKSIPLAGWQLIAAIPTTSLFTPLRGLSNSRLILGLAIAILITSILVWLLLRKMFDPMTNAVSTLSAWSEQPDRFFKQKLLVNQDDEIGTLIKAFNRLLSINRDREERLSLAASSTGVGIWDLDIQTMKLVWDESMFDLYDIKREDFSNAVDAWEKSLHPDDRQRAEHEIEEAINNIKPFDTEFRIIRSNGEIRDIEAVAKVFFSDDGTPLRMLGTNIDITERAIVERMKAEFVTTAAHELRTPLTIINGYTELLNMDVGSKDEQREMLSAIHSHSQAMIHLLNDMLDIAKIEAQAAGIYHMEPQQIGPRLQTLADTFITKSNRNKIALEISPNLPEVKVDVAKIEQAVMNCLSNAYKFSPKRGEVTMRVTEVTHDKQRKVLIAIEDQGIGMTPEQLERVFEKFYRADPSGLIPGTGLGMAIIKSIIEQHGGSIVIESELGKGTKVMLYLPVAVS